MPKTIYIFLCVLFFASCNGTDGTSTLIVKLTDSPGDYEKVNIDLQSVEAHSSANAGSDGWQLINTNAGIYNLLALTNGVETIIANDTYPSGRISQLRLILGENNSVVIDGVEYSLNIPSGSQSGIKLLINENLTEGITYSILLDFDAAKSIVKNGASGKYSLKPVIKAITQAQDGAIKGIVEPAALNVAVYAISGTDTVGSTYAAEGEADFFLGGLVEGVYKVSYDPGSLSGYQSLSVDNVSVSLGKATSVAPVVLNQ